MVAFTTASPDQRLILQTWHTSRVSTRSTSQVLLRAWDGYGQRPISRQIQLSTTPGNHRWPTVLTLSDNRVLVVWESTAKQGRHSSLMYRIGSADLGTWSTEIAVPGAKAKSSASHSYPTPVLAPDGRVILVWLNRAPDRTKLMISRSDDDGRFAAPTSPSNLPSGITQLAARLSAGGALHLVVQAPRSAESDGAERMAVYHAVSRRHGAHH